MNSDRNNNPLILLRRHYKDTGEGCSSSHNTCPDKDMNTIQQVVDVQCVLDNIYMGYAMIRSELEDQQWNCLHVCIVGLVNWIMKTNVDSSVL